jgi:hypothetical protein
MEMARRIIAALNTDFDMANLFPSATPMENLEDAASGSYEILPRKTLRERGYGKQPIRVMPDYSGDFLNKLRSPIQGKPVEVEASDPTNLLDFSNPEEMLKHQEQPNPRVMLDDFIEFPVRLTDKGDEWGDRALREFDDRSWDDTDAPEMSEDKIWRMWRNPKTKRVIQGHLKSLRGPSPSTVATRHIASQFKLKFGMLLTRLEESILPSKKERRPVRENPSSVRLLTNKSNPRTGHWEFLTGSKGNRYTTIFQFIPKGNETDLRKLDVQVSCNCNSWFFWGAQYNALVGNYLYGPANVHAPYGPLGRPIHVNKPEKRDPRGEFLVCKHIPACIPILLQQKIDLSGIPEDTVEKRRVELRREPEVKVELPSEKEKREMRIPPQLKRLERKEPLRSAIRKWERMNPNERKDFINELRYPGDVHYLGYRFPETSLEFVVPKLKEMTKSTNMGIRSMARDYLRQYLMAPRVVCAHLMDRFPMETVLNYQNVKVAKLLSEFEDSMIYSSKEDSYRKLEYDGVKIALARAEPRSGRWTFDTTSGDKNYSTVFQFVPYGNVREANKLHVRVSCSCPSFLYWGAQFNAVMGDYLYGDIRPKFTPPQVRDPDSRFKVCKHIMACIPVVSKYRVMEISEDTRKQLQQPPKFDLKNLPKEKLRIPDNLMSIGKQKFISRAVKNWDKMSAQARRKFIMGLEKPDQVAYMAHRFPETATLYAVDRIRELSMKEKSAGEFLRYWI